MLAFNIFSEWICIFCSLLQWFVMYTVETGIFVSCLLSCVQNTQSKCLYVLHVDANKKWRCCTNAGVGIDVNQSLKLVKLCCKLMRFSSNLYANKIVHGVTTLHTLRTYPAQYLQTPLNVKLKLFRWCITFWKNCCNTCLCKCMQTKTRYFWNLHLVAKSFP